MIGESPICMDCEHYDPFSTDKFSCKAYPEGIPDKIIMGEVDHKKPYKGDKGIRFKKGEPNPPKKDGL